MTLLQQLILICVAALLLPAAGFDMLQRGDLLLQVLGPVIYLHGENVTVKSGSAAAIYCFSTIDYPLWKIPAGSQWKQDRTVTREGTALLYGAGLTMEAAGSEDSGTYECVGSGHQTFYMTLQVTEDDNLSEYVNNTTMMHYYNLTEDSETTGLDSASISAQTTKLPNVWKDDVAEANEIFGAAVKDDLEAVRNWTEELLKIHTEIEDYFSYNIESNEAFQEDYAFNLVDTRILQQQQNETSLMMPKDNDIFPMTTFPSFLNQKENTRENYTFNLADRSTLQQQRNETSTVVAEENSIFPMTTFPPPVLNTRKNTDGNIFTVYMLQFPKFLEGDIVEIEMGQSKTITCSSFQGYPSWKTPPNSKTRRHSVPLTVFGLPLYASYVNITKARLEDRGQYECVSNGSSAIITVHVTGIKCPPLRKKDYMNITLSNGRNVGSWASFSCMHPRKLYGWKRIRCRSNGKWYGSVSTCRIPYACDALPPLLGGTSTYIPPNRSSGFVRKSQTEILPPNLHRLGTRVRHKCNSDYYKFTGSKVRRCLKGGRWSGRPTSCQPICGLRQSSESETTVNGDVEDIKQWPWQAAIFRHFPNKGWFFYCGASLLNERWVVTAAHCLTQKSTNAILKPHFFQVYVGKYHFKNEKNKNFMQVKKVQALHVHPEYNPQFLDSDIALLQLNSSVHLSDRVRPICLPTKETAKGNLVEGRIGIFTGWGMNATGNDPEVLQQSAVPVSKSAICEKHSREAGFTLPVTDNMFCAGTGVSDVCKGYSGGPMAFEVGPKNKRRWVLEGIVSFGSPEGCRVVNQYSGFTKVVNFVDWIREHL